MISMSAMTAAQVGACSLPMETDMASASTGIIGTTASGGPVDPCHDGQDACTVDSTSGHCAYGGPTPVCCTGCIDQSGVCQKGTSNTVACGMGGTACAICISHPQNDALACLETACVAAECVWKSSPVGTECKEITGPGYTCNGNGVCEDADETCKTTADCPLPPPCHEVRCNDTVGPRHGKCDVFSHTDDKACTLPICSIATKGQSATLCATYNATSLAYLCGYPSGPQLGAGVCVQPNPNAFPDTWCCNLAQ